MHKKIFALKIILIVWLVFSVLYVAYNEWMRFRFTVMQNPYNQGVGDAVGKMIEESKSCKAFPVNIGESKVTLVNVDCLKRPAGAQPDNSVNK
jgi:hypothetical protein